MAAAAIYTVLQDFIPIVSGKEVRRILLDHFGLLLKFATVFELAQTLA